MSSRLNVVRFWTNYMPDPNKPGEMKAIDMVEYHSVGAGGRSHNIEAVSRLAKLHPKSMAVDNPAIAAAHARWAQIEPAYRAWKHGEEVPQHGTPLAAWPGISTEQASALRAMGLRTVEDVRDATDGIITKVPFPGGRELRDAAKVFLSSADKVKLASEMGELKSENATLKEQLEELRQLVLAKEADDDEAPAKRRGRPPRVEVAA